MNLINLTPHAITVGDVTIPPSGSVARVTTVETVVGEYCGIPVVTKSTGEVVGLVYDDAGQIKPCIVSGMVLDAMPVGTVGVFAPDTGSTAVRNDKGHIVSVTRLVTK